MSDSVIVTPETTGASRGAPLSSIVLTIVSIASLALSCWCLRETRTLQSQISQRPPLAVIPQNDLLRQAMSSSDQRAVVREGTAIKAAAKALRAKGYIVLDGDHLVSWPRSFEVQPRANDGQDDAGDGEAP